MKKKFNSIAQLFSMHKISKMKLLKALTFQCIRPLMSKPLTRSQAEGLFIKDRNTLKSQSFKAFQFHFQKPGIDKRCIVEIFFSHFFLPQMVVRKMFGKMKKH